MLSSTKDCYSLHQPPPEMLGVAASLPGIFFSKNIESNEHRKEEWEEQRDAKRKGQRDGQGLNRRTDRGYTGGRQRQRGMDRGTDRRRCGRQGCILTNVLFHGSARSSVIRSHSTDMF